MSQSDSKNSVPEETVARLAAVLTRVNELHQQRALLARLVFSQAHTLKGAQLLTLLYAGKQIVREEAALTAA